MLRLIDARRRLFGGWLLTLKAAEAGQLRRQRTRSRNLIGDPVLLLERATVERGQMLRWRTAECPKASPGALIDADALPSRPGPDGIAWRATPLL